MNESATIAREMLKRGFLLSPEAVELVRTKPELGQRLYSSKLVITLGDLSRRVSVVRSAEAAKANTTVDALTDYYNARLAFYRSLLEPKADRRFLVSIAKAATPGSRVSVIGMVRDVHPTDVKIEDGTGSIRVYTNERLLEDECVLVTGTLEREGLAAEEIIFPDMPLDRPARTSAESVRCLISHTIPDGVNNIIIITNPEVEPTNVERLAGDNEVVWPDGAAARVLCPRTPCVLSVCGLTLLIHRMSCAALKQATGMEEPERAVVRLLRARHLDPRSYVRGDPLLLREVPDVICLVTGVPFTINYKGVTVVSPAADTAYAIDLKTRLVERLIQ